MNKLSKTLIATAITGLMAIPAAHAVDNAVYSKSSVGSVRFSGNGCQNDNENKLDATLYITNAFGAGIEGGIEGGSNTGFFEFSMFLFGDSVDSEGLLVASNSGRTQNMDTSADGYDDLQSVMSDYVDGDFNDGCNRAQFFNYDTMVNRFENRLSRNGERAKMRIDVEGTYRHDNGNDRRVRLRIKTGNMDRQNLM